MALGTVAPPDAGPAPSDAPPRRRPGARAFLRWSAGAYLGVTALMVAAMVARTGLPLTYVLDDPAIHLNMARQLAGHGTWGVAHGSFESASSAPLWTLLLTPFVV